MTRGPVLQDRTPALPNPLAMFLVRRSVPCVTPMPGLVIFPGLAIFVATLSFNVLGDGLRDALDPRSL